MSKSPYRFFQTSDGLQLRYNRWHCQSDRCRGTVFLMGGRTEFMEKYHETISDLNGRGLDVFSFDWRGQGGSQRLLSDPTKGHVQTYDHYISDLEQLMDMALPIACPKPWFVLAHSMGAHIALHYLSRYAHNITAAVLLAPMVNINTAPLPTAVLRSWSRWMVRWGRQGLVLPGSHHGDGLHKAFNHNRLTSDPIRFQHVQQILRSQPHLAVAGTTFGWLAATFDAIDTLQSPGFVQNVNVPSLMVLAGGDQVVSNAAAQNIAEKLDDNTLVTIPKARHEILMERDSLRLKFWQAFDVFVDPFL